MIQPLELDGQTDAQRRGWLALLMVIGLAACESGLSEPGLLSVPGGNYWLVFEGSAGGVSSCRPSGFDAGPALPAARIAAPIVVQGLGARTYFQLAEASSSVFTMVWRSPGTSITGSASGTFAEDTERFEIDTGSAALIQGSWDPERREGVGLATGAIRFYLGNGVLTCPTARWSVTPR